MIVCPHCQTQSSRVLDKRNKPDGRVKRRRRCDGCGFRYSTCEVVIFEGQYRKNAELWAKLKTVTR